MVSRRIGGDPRIPVTTETKYATMNKTAEGDDLLLKLILGRAKTGKTTRMMQMVSQCPAEGMSTRIVIVPEQLSHQTERVLSGICGDSISFTAEVLSFTRLQNRVGSIYGGNARNVLDQAGRLLTARLALNSISSRMKVFASASVKTEFLSGILSMIDEFKSYDVTPEMLGCAARESEGFFSQKLQELSEILGAYNAVTARSAYDPRDKLTLLCRQLKETDYADGRWFFVDGFIDFSAQEMQVLEALLRRCESMVITLPWDEDPADKALFAPAEETLARLISLAGSAGQKVEVIHTDYHREIPPELIRLERDLFRFRSEPFPAPADAIRIVSAEDRLEEIRHCASELRRLAMDGIPWRRMYVAAGDPDYYGPVLEAVFREYGIPVYTGIKKPITGHRAAAFLLSGLEAAVEGLDTETVISYIRSGYCGIARDECDLLENYAFTWSVSGSRWNTEWTEHPDGYDGKFTDSTREELSLLNRLRRAAVGPLLRLSAGIKSAGNVRGQVQAIYQFLEDTDLHSKMTDQLREETDGGNLEAAQETAQIWNTMIECLQQIVSVLGGTAVRSDELLKIFRTTLSQYELGTIPAVLEAVSFGGIDSVRGIEPDVLYVLGANEGLIPEQKAGNSLLTEQERRILRDQMEIRLAPDSEGAMERQMLQIYSAFSSPRKKLFVSYSVSNGGESQQPSFLVGRLKRMFPGTESIASSDRITDAGTVSGLTQLYLLAEEQGQASLQDLIRDAAHQVPELENAIVSAKAASLPRELLVPQMWTERIFGREVTLTASRLDQLAKCPLSFFLNYGLKAKPVKEASFDAAEYGTFLHYILEHTVADVVESGSELPLTEEQSRSMIRAYMEPYLQDRIQEESILSEREKYLYLRNMDEAGRILSEITEELSVSDFKPCGYELTFGSGGQMGQVTVHSTLGAGHLDGTVDRVDLWKSPEGDYFRIVDYKSGTKVFDYTDLSRGVGMQLFLYLFALRRSGIPDQSDHPIPAGALYLPTKRIIRTVEAGLDDVEAEKAKSGKDPKRSGLVLGAPDVLQAMDHDLAGRYLPVKKLDNPGEYAITESQMDLLETFISRQMERAVENVFSGRFIPEPYYRKDTENACLYCEYGDVCQKDPDFRRSFYTPKISAKEFWSGIGGEDHG